MTEQTDIARRLFPQIAERSAARDTAPPSSAEEAFVEEFTLPSTMEGEYAAHERDGEARLSRALSGTHAAYGLPMVYPLGTKQCSCGVRYHAAECPRCKRERDNREAYYAEQRRREWGWQALSALILLACMVAGFLINLCVIRW